MTTRKWLRPKPKCGVRLLACCRARPFEPIRRQSLSELRNSLSLFENNSGVVASGGARRLTFVHYSGVGPERDALAAAATLFVTHHRPPLGAIDISMGVWGWCVIGIDHPVVTSAQYVANLMRNRVRDNCA